MKTTILLTILSLTVGCSGTGKLYVGDLKTTTATVGKAIEVEDFTNFAVDIERTATGGILVSEFDFGAVQLDAAKVPGQNKFVLGYSPEIKFTRKKGGKESYTFTGTYTSASSECSTGFCQIELKGHGEWNYLEDGTKIVADVTWDFSGLAY